MATRSTLCAVLLLALSVPARAGHAQLIQGTVLEDPSGQPIVGDKLFFFADNELWTSDGTAAGTYRLSVSRMGYAPGRSDLFVAGPDDEPSLEIYLAVEPVPLESLEVVGEPRAPQLELVGFYKRMEKGYGHFILREEIERRPIVWVTDIFYGIPGVRVVAADASAGEYDVSLRGGGWPTVVLDGVVVRGGCDKGSEIGRWGEVVHWANIEAIEVYKGAGAPVQYGGMRGGCGTILIWTRR